MVDEKIINSQSGLAAAYILNRDIYKLFESLGIDMSSFELLNIDLSTQAETNDLLKKLRDFLLESYGKDLNEVLTQLIKNGIDFPSLRMYPQSSISRLRVILTDKSIRESHYLNKTGRKLPENPGLNIAFTIKQAIVSSELSDLMQSLLEVLRKVDWPNENILEEFFQVLQEYQQFELSDLLSTRYSGAEAVVKDLKEHFLSPEEYSQLAKARLSKRKEIAMSIYRQRTIEQKLTLEIKYKLRLQALSEIQEFNEMSPSSKYITLERYVDEAFARHPEANDFLYLFFPELQNYAETIYISIDLLNEVLNIMNENFMTAIEQGLTLFSSESIEYLLDNTSDEWIKNNVFFEHPNYPSTLSKADLLNELRFMQENEANNFFTIIRRQLENVQKVKIGLLSLYAALIDDVMNLVIKKLREKIMRKELSTNEDYVSSRELIEIAGEQFRNSFVEYLNKKGIKTEAYKFDTTVAFYPINRVFEFLEDRRSKPRSINQYLWQTKLWEIESIDNLRDEIKSMRQRSDRES